jgi:hypothetical protein
VRKIVFQRLGNCESYDDIPRIRRLAPEEKEHFTICLKCGEMFDRRSWTKCYDLKDKTNAQTN